MNLNTGLAAIMTHTVVEAELATHWGGQAEVFASPALIGAMERTCMRATDHLLDQGLTTVGVSFAIDHQAPTPAGWDVSIEATLTEIDRRMLTFSVVARDRAGQIAEGKHVRCVVDQSKFDERLRSRIASNVA